MPTNVFDSGAWRAYQGLLDALRDIKTTSGFNTTPRLLDDVVLVDKVAEGDFPALAVEMGDMELNQEQLGGGSQGLVYFDWPANVWGYVKSTGGKEDLYAAGAALLVDVQAAIWTDETLQDGAGQGRVLFATPGQITFDMEAFSAINKGYFVAEFRLTFAVTRGANP